MSGKRKSRHAAVLAAAQEGDGTLLLLTLALLVFGWLVLYSASALTAEARFGDQYYFVKKQLIWIGLGLTGLLAASRLKLEAVQRLARPVYIMTVILLAAVLVAGHEVGGAKRWLRIAGFGLQPSEFAKLAVVLFLADRLDRHRSRLSDFWGGFIPCLAAIGMILGLILLEKDLGTPFLIACVAAGLLFLAGARLPHLAATALAAVPLLYFAVFHVAYRRQRFLAFLDPWKDAQGSGYQLVQSLMALGAGGIFGKGSGESTVKLHYLPEAQTDFIFPILGEEFGFVGSALLTVLFLALVHRCFLAARGAVRFFHVMLAAGVGLWLGGQVIVNLAVVTGLMPTKGMPLPFISFGGSSMIAALTGVGLVLNVSRQHGAPVLGGAKR